MASTSIQLCQCNYNLAGHAVNLSFFPFPFYQRKGVLSGVAHSIITAWKNLIPKMTNSPRIECRDCQQPHEESLPLKRLYWDWYLMSRSGEHFMKCKHLDLYPMEELMKSFYFWRDLVEDYTWCHGLQHFSWSIWSCKPWSISKFKDVASW